MKSSPMRRAQLIAPFGVGAMFTAPDGTSMITAGLDGWFDTQANFDLQLEEFRVSEWRLEHNLRVNQLRLPPDYRRRLRGQEVRPNMGLEVPALLFPLWHFCPSPSCRALIEIKPHHGRRRRCPVCERRMLESTERGPGARHARFLAQVPFIAMCSAGHLEDFPWREWVHRDVNPQCRKQMYLKATGGATLASQMVSCDCGIKARNLSQITEAFNREGEMDTHVSASLASGDDRYVCRGRRPWVDDRLGEGCGLPVRGSLRASTSAYFSHVVSAIFLPGGSIGLPDGLIEALDKPPLKYKIDTLRQLAQVTVEQVRLTDHDGQMAQFADGDIERALEALESGKDKVALAAEDSEVDSQSLRRPEFNVLREALKSEDLMIRPQELGLFTEGLHRYFSRINLIDTLRETRVMYGFSRIEPNPDRPMSQMKAQMWNTEPDVHSSWLPAYVVRGEGIYLELDEAAVGAWERRPEVVERVSLLASHPHRTRVHPGLADPSLVPRFVAIHTLAHLLINQLVFECGYSSAALRERLFCSGGTEPMAAILIYTAAGDSEGTMGGLVRMGKPGKFEPALIAAIDRAKWCSADPVCMELGERGQGPQSMNLAACHACALLPETACEVFNMFLDRALVTGSHEKYDIGFLSSLD